MERGQAGEIGFPLGDLVVELLGEVFARRPGAGNRPPDRVRACAAGSALPPRRPSGSCTSAAGAAAWWRGCADRRRPGRALSQAGPRRPGDAPALEEGRHQGLFLLGGQRDGVHQLVEHPGTGQGAGQPLLADEAVGFLQRVSQGRPGGSSTTAGSRRPERGSGRVCGGVLGVLMGPAAGGAAAEAGEGVGHQAQAAAPGSRWSRA